MPRYRLDATGRFLVLDEKSIGEDGYFPETYPEKLPDGSDNPRAGEPHEKAGQINWAHLKDCGFHKKIEVLPYDEKTNLRLNASAPHVTVSQESMEGVRANLEREIEARLEKKFQGMLVDALKAAGVNVKKIKALKPVAPPPPPPEPADEAADATGDTPPPARRGRRAKAAAAAAGA